MDLRRVEFRLCFNCARSNSVRTTSPTKLSLRTQHSQNRYSNFHCCTIFNSPKQAESDAIRCHLPIQPNCQRSTFPHSRVKTRFARGHHVKSGFDWRQELFFNLVTFPLTAFAITAFAASTVPVKGGRIIQISESAARPFLKLFWTIFWTSRRRSKSGGEGT
jgi:hypothetical protein